MLTSRYLGFVLDFYCMQCSMNLIFNIPIDCKLSALSTFIYSGDGAVDKTHAFGVRDCETPMCP